MLQLGCPVWSGVASPDFPGSRDSNRLVAEGTGVLNVEPLAEAALVEKMAAGRDHGEGQLLEADGAEVVVLLQLPSAGPGEQGDLGGRVPVEGEAPPAGSGPQPDVEIAVDDDDRGPCPRPLPHHGAPDAVVAAHGWLWGCLLLACWGSPVLGQDKIEVLENQGVSLPCKAIQTQPNPTRQEWKFQKDGVTLLFYHANKFTDNYKGRATFTPHEIHLAAVTRKDSGWYTCEVLGASFAQSQVELVVQVPPSKPTAHVPSVVTIGNKAVLRCEETDANPRPTFKWFKDNVQMPPDPKTSTIFKNSSYTIDADTGVLAFEPATALDAGDYSCEAANKVGTPQRSEAIRMETMERRRRDKINNWIVQLSKIIPDCSLENTKSGQSKGGILSKACDYIQELRQNNIRLSEELQGLEQLQVDNEVLRQQVEDLKNKNLILRAQLRQHGVEVIIKETH